jgi:hypothetical protein
MELTIEIPDKLIQRAAELGVPVKSLVSQALEQISAAPPAPSKAENIADLLAMPEGSDIDFDPPRLQGPFYAEEPIPPGFVRLGVPTMTREEATASIREIQKNHTLGGLKIKDLIEEGRRC